MELVLALIIGMGTYEYMKKDEIDPSKHQLIDSNPGINKVLYTGKGQYVHNTVVQEESEVKWIISTN